jgi:hypothetical protein
MAGWWCNLVWRLAGLVAGCWSDGCVGCCEWLLQVMLGGCSSVQSCWPLRAFALLVQWQCTWAYHAIVSVLVFGQITHRSGHGYRVLVYDWLLLVWFDHMRGAFEKRGLVWFNFLVHFGLLDHCACWLVMIRKYGPLIFEELFTYIIGSVVHWFGSLVAVVATCSMSSLRTGLFTRYSFTVEWPMVFSVNDG